MKLMSLAMLTALVVRHVYASSDTDDPIPPTGIPATSGPPFSTLSFDTTAPPSILSALSSLISSESTAVTPFTVTSHSAPTTSSGSALTLTATGTPSSSPPTATSPVVTFITPSSTPTTSTTSGARSLRDVHLQLGVVAGVVVAALV